MKSSTICRVLDNVRIVDIDAINVGIDWAIIATTYVPVN